MPRPFFRRIHSIQIAVLLVFMCGQSTVVHALDEDAAVALGKKGHCFKCHAVEKRKKAPSYREIAAKYKNKKDAERSIIGHFTGNPTVKVDDADERHEGPPTEDPAELENLAQWILSR